MQIQGGADDAAAVALAAVVQQVLAEETAAGNEPVSAPTPTGWVASGRIRRWVPATWSVHPPVR